MPKRAEPSAVPIVQSIPLERISEAPFNPRKSFTDIEELAEDVKRRGVLQPVLVRSFKDDSYQLIFGARRYRAAKLAGLEAIPAMVRDMTDAEALEIAIVENAKRSDVHPLEEADAYRELHTRHGYDVETIAAKVGKSAGYVYARMKLCELCEAGRKAFFAERLTAATALCFARIGDPASQEGAVEELLRQWRDDEAIPLREVVWHVRQRFTQDLSRASFDTTDPNLLTAAGACTTCPKRSGANPDLFSDIKEKDICTDTACFRTKVAHAAEQKKAEAQEKGLKVLEKKEAEKALSYASPYVKLADRCYDHPKQSTWRQVLKKAPVEKVVAIGQDGAAHELVLAKEAKAALVDAGEEWAKSVYVRGAVGGSSYGADQRARQKAAKLRAQVVQRALVQLGDAVRAIDPADTEFWRDIAKLLVHRAGFEETHLLGQVLELGADRQKVEKALLKRVEDCGPEELQALMIQLLVAPGASGGTWNSGYGETFRETCAQYRIDIKAIEKELKAAAKTKKPAKKKARKAVAA